MYLRRDDAGTDRDGRDAEHSMTTKVRRLTGSATHSTAALAPALVLAAAMIAVPTAAGQSSGSPSTSAATKATPNPWMDQESKAAAKQPNRHRVKRTEKKVA